MSKEYFPNEWQTVKDLPESMIGLIEYEDVMENRVYTWELPSDVCAIIRVLNRSTNKVSEFVYTRPGNARNKLVKLVEDDNNEILVCHPESIVTIAYKDEEHQDDTQE